jgi:hypothetical protein
VRGARTLYALHLGVGLLAIGLIAGAVITVLAASDLSIPSAAAVSRACADWLSAGGPGAIVGLLVLALAAALVVKGVRSAIRQLRAGRDYLGGLPLGPAISIAGARCRTIESAEPLAFCAGYLRPRIYVSRRLIDGMSSQELRAVIAHESHHAGRHDPLRRLVARALADALFFVALLGRSSDRYAALGELAADEAAVAAAGGRAPLASALLKFSEHEAGALPVAGIAPERVDHLTGDPEVGRWRLSAALIASSTAAILALAAVVTLASAVGAAVDWPLLLAAGCMAGMVVGPIALALAALVVSRRAIAARRS